ncbi:type I methionyl aminopeptidase [Candidatus Parcubacteria bacterium]|nr:type I methionyl aminopeptidase [Patescibacteria group bacterium]MBU4381130.1 type I methionyl aminopeptidase [Patescibacteria group bacterium]MCG2689147.1 type I methionyl aminopeptidase [Candidatus Parcubacteria bacterium]
MVIIKTPQEIEEIYLTAQIAKKVMERTLGWIHPGLKTANIDKFVSSQLKSLHAKSSFLGEGGYKFSTCISINDEVVHGMPGGRKVKKGDLLSLDMGALFGGWKSDMCRTIVVGQEPNPATKKFLQIGQLALDRAINAIVPGNFVGDISCTIQNTIERAGYNVIRDLTGHAIGKELHEDPQIPCFGRCSSGVSLVCGMVLCVEVMYVAGSPELAVSRDGWTVKTKDGKLSAMLEDMVAVTENGYRILTR